MRSSGSVTFAFDPGEARDDHGRWSDGGGSGDSPSTDAVRSLAGGYKGATLGVGRTTLKPGEKLPAGVQAVADRGTDMSPEAVQARLDGYFAKGVANGTSEEDRLWYDQQHALIGDLAQQRGIDPERLAGMIAVTSPLTSWEANVPKALAADGMSSEFADIDTHTLASETEHPGMFRGQLEKAIGIDRGELDPADVLKDTGSPKTTSFYNNLVDPSDPASVTVDTHMAQAMLGDPEASTQDVKALVSGRGYAWSADQIRSAAAAHGMIPSQYQSAVWVQLARGW